MEHVRMISGVLTTIEEHLYSRDLTPESLAKQYYTNVADLQKVFQILTNFTIGEYIRNRRLSNASIILQKNDAPILDIALEIGYETHEAFSKAFKRFHGISPKEARTETCADKIKYFGPLHIKFSLENSPPLVGKIEQCPTMYFVGKIIDVPTDSLEYLPIIEHTWKQEMRRGTLYDLSDQYHSDGLTGISLSEDKEALQYGIGILTHLPPEPLPMYETIKLEARRWVKFTVNGIHDEDFRLVRNRVLTEWLPMSSHSISMLPEIEYYPNLDEQSPEIWFPIL
ncbi:helix-turn-helix domain-containing protein [Paenibacillus sp. GCM10012306]|uniref:AraC family transcriptional regulator n=1 Tax=Paenibacillus sp. GCM10012306 TaxID=3317342 RepID=UPI0036223D34